MKFIPTKLQGVYIIEQNIFNDKRGSFVKTFSKSIFDSQKIECNFSENYYTQSAEHVIRGMHFQSPPHDHAKLVTVISGTILDVILDIREDSPTYKQFIAIELSRENRKSIYIPRGLAHGFGVLHDSAIAYYMVTSEHQPSHDLGIRYDSFGFDWPIQRPIVSERDQNFVTLENFKTPFVKSWQ